MFALRKLCRASMALAARPTSTASQARFSALISSARSVSFLTSMQSLAASSATQRSVQWGLEASKREETGREAAAAAPLARPLVAFLAAAEAAGAATCALDALALLAAEAVEDAAAALASGLDSFVTRLSRSLNYWKKPGILSFISI